MLSKGYKAQVEKINKDIKKIIQDLANGKTSILEDLDLDMRKALIKALQNEKVKNGGVKEFVGVGSVLVHVPKFKFVDDRINDIKDQANDALLGASEYIHNTRFIHDIKFSEEK